MCILYGLVLVCVSVLTVAICIDFCCLFPCSLFPSLPSFTVTCAFSSDDWYGFLSSALCQSKKSNLVLTVLYPGSEVPRLGSME